MQKIILSLSRANWTDRHKVLFCETRVADSTEDDELPFTQSCCVQDQAKTPFSIIENHGLKEELSILLVEQTFSQQ